MKVHKFVSSVLLGLVVLLLPIVGFAAEEPGGGAKAALKRRVSALIEQLDSDIRKDRVRAEREFLKLGPGILPLLPPPELLPSASVRESLRRIRIRLERTKAFQSIRPSRVTLKQTLPLAELLQAVAAQTGNVLDVSALPEELGRQACSVDFGAATFWSVMQDLRIRAQLAFHHETETGQLKLLALRKTAQSDELIVVHSGAFRISVLSASLRPLLGDKTHRLLRMRLAVVAEPRLRPLFLQFSGADFSATSSHKRPLAPYTPDSKIELPFGEAGKGLCFDVNFRVPRSMELEHAALSGSITVLTAAGSEKISFTDFSLDRNVARRQGGVTVTLQEIAVEQTANAMHRARVRVAVSYDVGGPAFESHRTWIFHNRVFLETTDGQRIERSGPVTPELQTDGAVVVVYQFDDLKQDPNQYRFVYVAPTLIISVPVEFEFEKIPVRYFTAQRKP